MKNKDSKFKSDALEWSVTELEREQYPTLGKFLIAIVQEAESTVNNDPDQALKKFAKILEYLTDNETNLKKSHQRTYREALARAKEGAEVSKVKQLLKSAMTHIINLKTITLSIGNNWDYHEDTRLVLHENSQAKHFLDEADRMAGKIENKELQNEVWDLDDKRALESLAARDRISQRRLEVIAEAYAWDASETQAKVFVFTTCDILGGRFVYNVTIKNASQYVITNISTTIVAFPYDCMKLSNSANKTISRIEVGGFRRVKFTLYPTKDCVEGKISLVVSYIDHKDRLRTITPDSYVIRSVCDLLQPLESSTNEFENQLHSLIKHNQSLTLNWNAELLLKKAISILPRMNFYLIDSEIHHIGKMIVGTIRGFALGKYTEKRVAITMRITGEAEKQNSTIEVTLAGDDEAMLPTTIKELAEKIDSWVCLECGAKLNPEQIVEVEKGSVVQCRYCRHVLTTDLYCRGGQRPETGVMELTMSSEMTDIQYPPFEEYAKSNHAILDKSLVVGVNALRGCEVIGGRFLYKIKVENHSEYVITNVTTTIVAFPQDCLQMESDVVRSISRIEVDGFRSLEYSFVPAKDCVEGKIVSVVSFIDLNDNIHTLHVEPYIIRSVCDLLNPLESTTDDFELFLEKAERVNEEQEFEWNVQILFKIAEHTLRIRNFFVVNTEERITDNEYVGIIRGFAEGKYTSNRIALVVLISGAQNGRISAVRIEVLGDDDSMFPTTIEEVVDSMNSWLCLHCGGPLETDDVMQLKANMIIQCKHCGHILSLELYKV